MKCEVCGTWDLQRFIYFKFNNLLCNFLFIENSTSSIGLASSNTNAVAGGYFASPGLSRFRPKHGFGKQQSLDSSDSSDPMIGAIRTRNSFGNSTTSASAPPSPSALHQQRHQPLINNTLWVSTIKDQSFDYFGSEEVSIINDDFNSLETQRSQSVPLSQLQRIVRINSPDRFNQPGAGVGTTEKDQMFIEENDNNSSSQQSNNIMERSEREEANRSVFTSDSEALLGSVDVNDILSSPDLLDKFSGLTQGMSSSNVNPSGTTCSSTGSSSGYGSTCNTFVSSGSGASGIVSRSVPSTPLPHHQQNLFGVGNSSQFYAQRTSRGKNIQQNELQLSPESNSHLNHDTFSRSAFKYGQTNSTYSSQTRSVYDISRSMPTTPITTPCFSYSPTDFNRDYLINGSTIDSIASSTFASGSTNTGAEDSLVGNIELAHLNADTLLDDDRGVASDVFSVSRHSATDTNDGMLIESDLLGNL